MNKIPSADDYSDYSGAHTHKLWVLVGAAWRCPACDRSKFEVLRWTKRFLRSPSPFEGWMAPLHRHHDHGHGLFFADYARFPRTIICDQCNCADGQAKRRCCLPRDFSFAPWEIKEFVVSTPHAPHKIDLLKAKAIYDGLFLEPRSILSIQSNPAG